MDNQHQCTGGEATAVALLSKDIRENQPVQAAARAFLPLLHRKNIASHCGTLTVQQLTRQFSKES